MTKRRAKADKLKYLDALLSPNLGSDRKYALILMSEVEYLRIQNKKKKGNPKQQGVTKLTEKHICVNCNKLMKDAKLYCSGYCQRFSAMVRYTRKCIDLDKIRKRDIQAGIGINLLMLASGGYPTQERKLSEETRIAIFERDKYICQKCGKPATQIDHKKGNSPAPDNLSALCADCNREKAFEGAVPAKGERLKVINKMITDMAKRIASEKPMLVCDDYENWKVIQPQIRAARKRMPI